MKHDVFLFLPPPPPLFLCYKLSDLTSFLSFSQPNLWPYISSSWEDHCLQWIGLSFSYASPYLYSLLCISLQTSLPLILSLFFSLLLSLSIYIYIMISQKIYWLSIFSSLYIRYIFIHLSLSYLNHALVTCSAHSRSMLFSFCFLAFGSPAYILILLLYPLIFLKLIELLDKLPAIYSSDHFILKTVSFCHL